ncbi:hypothetical protein [Marinobacterium jannaschii]|uniref:hypothetical protein n=1 Tax=Marinobacterium jannaschii TaxID=64970 RepID=UPI000687736B|nr:hypothetical protein [Marinobacterium jannaschii]
MSLKPNENRQRRNRSLLFSVTAVLLLSLVLAGGYLFLASERQAEKSTQQLGQALARQTTLLIRPSLLSNDRISLNYLLNELSQLDYVAGLQLSDGKGAVIARAGEQTGLELRRTLLQQEESIGTLKLWLNTAPQKKSLQELLIQVLVLALAISSAVLMTISLSGRNRSHPKEAEGHESTEDTPQTSDSIDYSKQFEQLLQAETREQAQPPILDQTQAIKPEASTPAAPRPYDKPAPAKAPAPPVAAPAQPEITPALKAAAEQAADSTAEPASAPRSEQQPEHRPEHQSEPRPERREPTLETDTLVDLLRPEESTATPNLHSRQAHTDDPDQAIIAEEIELDEETPPASVAILRPVNRSPASPVKDVTDSSQAEAPATGSAAGQPLPAADAGPALKSKNPLVARREETQLPLYSFEQELELILPPEEAAYLFYIDTTSAHAEYADDEERAQLLRNYQYLAGQVASIYGGEALLLNDSNIQLSFAQPLEGDEHGINAICAAELFILLYKAFNQSRIRAFQPVMNLHMSLVRGSAAKLSLLLEEARFLTRTTQSNELISHTALTEAPELKQAILKDADIRREDEDKVLLLRVTKRYQELLQKQANHLLTKMKLN